MLNEQLLLVAGGSGSFARPPGDDYKQKKESGHGGGQFGTFPGYDNVTHDTGNIHLPRPGYSNQIIGANYLGSWGVSVKEATIGIGGVVRHRLGYGGSQGGGGYCGGGGSYSPYSGAGGSGYVNTKYLKNSKGIDGSGMKDYPSRWDYESHGPDEGACRISWIFKKSTYTYEADEHK